MFYIYIYVFICCSFIDFDTYVRWNNADILGFGRIAPALKIAFEAGPYERIFRSALVSFLVAMIEFGTFWMEAGPANLGSSSLLSLIASVTDTGFSVSS